MYDVVSYNTQEQLRPRGGLHYPNANPPYIDLTRLLGGPQAYCWEIFGKTFEHSALLTALEFSLPSPLPNDGAPLPITQIHESAKVPFDQERLLRILRLLVTTNLLVEEQAKLS
jgi:hypothetical protein